MFQPNFFDSLVHQVHCTIVNLEGQTTWESTYKVSEQSLAQSEKSCALLPGSSVTPEGDTWKIHLAELQ